MSIDLTQFHATFYEESFEALDAMEAALLSLDVGTVDAEAINTIFRVAHSIKGGAATFGFGQIASFTHSLENLLDQLRGQRMAVTSSLSELLLRSVDILRDMLRAQQVQQPMDAQRVADLQFDLELAVAQNGVAAESAAGALLARVMTAPAVPLHPWQIRFRPLEHMLARGNDPLRLFRELRSLGELRVQADLSSLPRLGQLDPERCHLAWTLQLHSNATRTAILEVFDWAEGDCLLEIEGPAEGPAAAVPRVSGTLAGDASGSAGSAAGTVAAGAAVVGAAVPGAAVPGAVRAAGTPSQSKTAATGAAAPGAAPPTAPEIASGVDAGSLRVSVEKIDDLMNSVSELVITQSMLRQFSGMLQGAAGERLRAGLAQLERNVRELQESVMRVRMVPITFVFSRFPRMVRDLSQRLGKLIDLRLLGGETELDKTVLEKIGDPLVHLVRNSIDHGIESPAQRRAAGKSERGQLQMHAYHRGSNIMVEVLDDGAGLNRERILAKARERGLIGADVQPGAQQIDELIFLPGFSTLDQVTDVSGRGVGMDVVRRNVESLGGGIEVNSTPGQGARFVITLPLTLAIIDGQTVAVGEESYIVPLTAIVESLQAARHRIQHIVGHGEVIVFRGEYLPVLRLGQQFGAHDRDAAADNGLLMVVEGEGRRVALLVDELLGQQQVVVKTLDTNYGHVEGIAGATILGNGSVALILDVASLTRLSGEARAA
ncbi:MAG TPA: chemotaxis protein CheA [Steroidobacteraceae bacterium]|jgi:two-component system chemotaxis sensor kinase CheA|nr:chemotaxis protein CheA [Steroidobacteraceae bacterium]